MKKSDLCVSQRKYTDKEGKEKNVYKTIGEITTFRREDNTVFSIVELYHMPGIKVEVFEQRVREESVNY